MILLSNQIEERCPFEYKGCTIEIDGNDLWVHNDKWWYGAQLWGMGTMRMAFDLDRIIEDSSRRYTNVNDNEYIFIV